MTNTLKAEVSMALEEMRLCVAFVEKNLFLPAAKLKPFVDAAVAAQRKYRKAKKAFNSHLERT